MPGHYNSSAMSATAPPKNYLFGGVVLCVFPAVVLVALHLNQQSLPMPLPIFFGLLFLHGLRAVIWNLFKLDIDNTFSWVIDAVGTAGFAVLAFWIAWFWKDGWSGGLPLAPNSWNQILARILFASGGLLATAFTVRLLRKARNRYRNQTDDGIKHT